MLGTHRLWISSRLTAMKIGGRSDLPFSYLNLSKIILNRRQVSSIKERITILKTNFEFLIFFSSLQDNNHCTIQFSIINTHTLIGLAIAQIGQQNGQQIGRVYFSKMYFWEVFILVFSFFSFPCGGWRRSIHQCWPNICHQCLNDVCPPKQSTAQKYSKFKIFGSFGDFSCSDFWIGIFLCQVEQLSFYICLTKLYFPTHKSFSVAVMEPDKNLIQH